MYIHKYVHDTYTLNTYTYIIHIYVHKNTYICKHIYIYAHYNTFIHIYLHTCTYTIHASYTYAHTCTYTRALARARSDHLLREGECKILSQARKFLPE